MFSALLFLLALWLISLRVAEAVSASAGALEEFDAAEGERRVLASEKKRSGSGKEALRAWAHSLTESDYNATNWRYKFRSKTPQVYFDQYLIDFSRKFAISGGNVNFVMVGACDGLADPTIRTRFLPNKHWRAVFVEPMTPNIRDLTSYLDKNGVLDRR
tara:strand:+ start:169 stop:645 length:477 start_codon:yes stop_codon:yes gene_type:complete